MEWTENDIEKAWQDLAPKYAKRGENLTREMVVEILDSLYAMADLLINSYLHQRLDMNSDT